MKILYLNRGHLKRTLSIRNLDAIQVEDFDCLDSIYRADKVIFTDKDGKTRILKDKEASELDIEVKSILKSVRITTVVLLETLGSIKERDYSSHSSIVYVRERLKEVSILLEQYK